MECIWQRVHVDMSRHVVDAMHVGNAMHRGTAMHRGNAMQLGDAMHRGDAMDVETPGMASLSPSAPQGFINIDPCIHLLFLGFDQFEFRFQCITLCEEHLHVIRPGVSKEHI